MVDLSPKKRRFIRGSVQLLILSMACGKGRLENSDLARKAEILQVGAVALDEAGQARFYLEDQPRWIDVDLPAGQSLVATASQTEVDIVLELVPPSAEVSFEGSLELDLPFGRDAPELLCYVAEDKAESWRLRVHHKPGDEGGAVVLAVGIQEATPEDRQCASALARLSRGTLPKARDWDEGLVWVHGNRPDLEPAWLNRFGFELFRASRFSEAKEVLRRVLEPGFQGNQGRTIGSVHRGRAFELLGDIAFSQSDTAAARTLYQTALEVWKTSEQPIEQSRTLAAIAAVFMMEARLGDARGHLDQALAILPTGARAARSEILMQLGWVHYLSEEPELALKVYEQGLAFIEGTGPSLEKAGFLDRMASAERQRGNLAAAEVLYRDALDELPDPDGLWGGHVRLNLGDLLVQQGRFDEGRVWLKEGVAAFDGQDLNGHAHTLAALGVLERKAGNPERALEVLYRATESADRLWLSAFREGNLTRPTSLVRDIDAQLVDLLLEQATANRDPGLLRQAFERSDYARVRNLVSLIQGTEETSERGWGTTPPRPLDSHALQASWPERTLLLSYVLGKERSHLLSLDGSGLRQWFLPSSAELDGLARAWLELSSSAAGPDALGQRERVEARLREVLLGPIWHLLTKVDRLVIVAEGALARLPFGVIPATRGSPLLETIDIVQGPSISVMSQLTQRQKARIDRKSRNGNGASQPGWIVFADPVYSANDSRCSACESASSPGSYSSEVGTHDSVWSRRLLRLPGTRREADAVLQWAPKGRARAYVGFDASRREVMGGALAAADALVFATHTHIDERAFLRSGLYLSRYDASGKVLEGFLSVEDIQSLKIEADLVVLPACESGWEEGVRGDGVIGFAQAFFIAGASQLLISQWPVDDRATADLMSEFYRWKLGEGLSTAESLRRAQMHVRQQKGLEEPYFWAGFVLLGSWM